MTSIRWRRTTLLLTLFTGIACDRDRTPNHGLDTTTPPNDVNVQPTPAPAANGSRQAVTSITDARCAREQRCGNLGPDKSYASMEACQTKTRADWRDELNTYECPGGMVQKELNECLEEIRNDNCSSPLDTLGRIVACRSSDICTAVP